MGPSLELRTADLNLARRVDVVVVGLGQILSTAFTDPGEIEIDSLVLVTSNDDYRPLDHVPRNHRLHGVRAGDALRGAASAQRVGLGGEKCPFQRPLLVNEIQ